MNGRWLRWCAAAAAFGMVAGAAPPSPLGAHEAAPPTREAYEDVVERLEDARRMVERMERRERGLRGEISSTDAQRRATEVELEELSALVEGAQGRLNEAQRSLDRMQEELEAKTAKLERLLLELEAVHDKLQGRAVRVYKSGPTSFAGFLLGADDFRELVSRSRYLFRVFARDEERITEIRDMRARVEREREEVATLRDEAAEQVEAVRAERDRVAGIKRSVDERRRRLASELQSHYAELESTRAERDRWEREQRELEEESQRIGAMLRGRTGGEASVGPGGMIRPAAGPITSGYGWRTHPVFGTRRFHAGIDIGAPTGRSAVAAAAGTVAFAGTRGGYGRTVIVDHGGGVATLYAHLSVAGAGQAQAVERGDVLGRIGCSGYCTGPHLHFEVRVNGEPQDPMRWLP